MTKKWEGCFAVLGKRTESSILTDSQTLLNGLTDSSTNFPEVPLSSPTERKFNIDNFEYWLAYNAHVDAQVTVAFYERAQRAFEKTYKVKNVCDKPSDSPEPSWIEEKINVTISDILYKALIDEELLRPLREANDAADAVQSVQRR